MNILINTKTGYRMKRLRQKVWHPFREGNGRTQRLFIEQLAKNSGYILNLSNVSQSTMIEASIQGAKGNIKGYEIILKEHLKTQIIEF